MIEKAEFEPRIRSLKERVARLEEQHQALIDAAALQATLSLIIGRLVDFAGTVQNRLAELDWTGKRDLIRTLVKRVEIGLDDVNVVFRVAPWLPGSSPAGQARIPALAAVLCKIVGSVGGPLLANIVLHRVLDLWVHPWRRRHPRLRLSASSLNSRVARDACVWSVRSPSRPTRTRWKPTATEHGRPQGAEEAPAPRGRMIVSAGPVTAIDLRSLTHITLTTSAARLVRRLARGREAHRASGPRAGTPAPRMPVGMPGNA
jgi:hypothetical protein